MTKTAIDWLEDELKANLKQIVLTQDDQLMESIFARARSKFVAQQQFAWEDGQESPSSRTFDQYYQETFKG
jgi:hypothetical protein